MILNQQLLGLDLRRRNVFVNNLAAFRADEQKKDCFTSMAESLHEGPWPENCHVL